MSDNQTLAPVSDEPPTWTEPPWSGWIETTGDALLILEAARRGLIPRVTRRLVESERKMITSGSVFVFDEDESGIKRWTDGFFWSPSRILGNFLLYRETEKRGASLRGSKSTDNAADGNDNGLEGIRGEGTSLSRPKGEPTGFGIDRARERVLVGSLTNSYKFKPGGMVKKTFSLTINGVAQHLISYYKVEDVEQGRLRSPSSLPEIASLDISPEYLDKQHFRLPPKIEICLDGVPRYRGEADDIDHSVDTLGSPLSSGLPLVTDGRGPAEGESSKRAKRYDPYSSSPSKRGRKSKKNATSSTTEQLSPTTEQQSQPSGSSPSVPALPSPPQPQSQQPLQSPQPQSPYQYGVPVQPLPGYPDHSMSMVPPHYPAYGVPPHYPSMPGYPLPMYPGSGPPQNSATPVPQQPQASPSAPLTPLQQYGYPNYPADHSQQMYSYYPPWPAYNGYGGMWPYPGYHTPGIPPPAAPSGVDVSSQVSGVGDEVAGVAAIHT